MKKSSSNNWKYKGKVVDSIDKIPEGAIGIIYKITNLDNNRYYFGRKTIVSMRKRKLTKKEKQEPENSRKTFVRELKETSGWQKYNGSNKPLLEDIKNGAKIKKEIIQFCFSKAELTFFETKAIVCSDCMFTEDCYNDWFSAKVYKSFLIKKKDNNDIK